MTSPLKQSRAGHVRTRSVNGSSNVDKPFWSSEPPQSLLKDSNEADHEADLYARLCRLGRLADQVAAEVANLKRDVKMHSGTRQELSFQKSRSKQRQPRPVSGCSPRGRAITMRNKGNRILLSDDFNDIRDDILSVWPAASAYEP